ncbi:MAG: chromosome partitioning protein ParB [Candidatus Sericytochromatia bacterium]
MPGRYAESDGQTRRVWDVERLWRLAEDLEPREIPLEEIVGLDSVTWFSEGGDQPTIRSIAAHARRILQADLSYPPLLTEDNRVFDGMHRIARSLMEGHSTIVVKKFLRNPPPDHVEPVL